MAPLGLTLEIELGITGGEEDGVNNEGVDNAALYSQPDDVLQAYEALGSISDRFTIAAAFGNVHGVYASGRVRLHPELLEKFQEHVKEKTGRRSNKPVLFVFHGGSGSTEEQINKAVASGIVKMNIDTDTQWAYWDGVRGFEKENHDFLQGQLGNPKGADKPNKKFYDPRVWLRKGEQAMIERVKQAFKDLNCIGVLAPKN